MDPALFSPSYLFRGEDGEEGEEGEVISTQQQTYEERNHVFPGGVELHIREFSFHQLNANFLWPGTFVFSEWLLQHQSCLRGQRILELGSGTGALAIFLRKSFGADITTSDIDDEEVEGNIAHNCRSNGLAVLPHIRHTWGDTFPTCAPGWELVIASDILLYVKQYSNLIKTLCFLLKSYKHNDDKKEVHGDSSIKKTVTIAGKDVQRPVFLMSWRRRIGKDEDALFFRGCANAGLRVEHFGSRVYCISPGLGN